MDITEENQEQSNHLLVISVYGNYIRRVDYRGLNGYITPADLPHDPEYSMQTQANTI